MNPSKIRSHWRLCAVLAVAAAAWLLRGPILGIAAWGLIVDQDNPRAGYLWLVGDDDCYKYTVEAQRRRPAVRVLISPGRRRRTAQLGVRPPSELVALRELTVRGMPQAAAEILDGEPGGAAEMVQQLKSWMASRPDAEVLLVCDQFSSRSWRHLLDSSLDPSSANRVLVHPVRSACLNESNWWRTRYGVKLVGCGYLDLVYTWWQGTAAEEGETWCPDEYEDALRRKLAECRR